MNRIFASIVCDRHFPIEISIKTLPIDVVEPIPNFAVTAPFFQC